MSAQSPSYTDQKKKLKNKRKKFKDFQIRLIKRLERGKRLRLSALHEILPDLINRLKSNSSSKFEIIEDVAKLWRVLTGEMFDLEQDPTVCPAVKSKARALADWIKRIFPSFRKTFYELCFLHKQAIIEQGGRVKSLRTERTSRTVLVEAEWRLKALKAEYLSDTGEEWSDVREEGPIILTNNAVTGNEVSPELTDIVKQLKREKAMRYLMLNFYNQ